MNWAPRHLPDRGPGGAFIVERAERALRKVEKRGCVPMEMDTTDLIARDGSLSLGRGWTTPEARSVTLRCGCQQKCPQKRPQPQNPRLFSSGRDVQGGQARRRRGADMSAPACHVQGRPRRRQVDDISAPVLDGPETHPKTQWMRPAEPRQPAYAVSSLPSSSVTPETARRFDGVTSHCQCKCVSRNSGSSETSKCADRPPSTR